MINIFPPSSKASAPYFLCYFPRWIVDQSVKREAGWSVSWNASPTHKLLNMAAFCKHGILAPHAIT